MPRRLDATEPDFAAAFDALLGARREVAVGVDGVVAEIIDDVRARGDAALIEYTARFDGLELSADTLRLILPDDGAAPRGAAVERRFQALAETLGASHATIEG